MKRFKSLSLKKKRTLAIAGVSLLMLTVVGTIAYHQDSMFFANFFRLQDDVVEFSETFDSPDDWQPCQEIPKTAIATNKNASPRYVRMKINEYWRTKNSQTSADDHETTDLPLSWTEGGVEKRYAIINTQNDDKWELKSDGWYYYKTTLAQNESTDSLLKSVTFNCEVNTVGEIRYTVGGTVGEGVPSDYAEANYHLYITFQMSDEDMTPQQHQADCDSDELYDIIACLTNGPDTAVNFRMPAGGTTNADGTFSGSNGYGVNTIDEHKNDFYPTYYYRGNVATNHVLFADNCWLIIRTTDTGGVKLLYDGKTNNGKCTACYDARGVTFMPYADWGAIKNNTQTLYTNRFGYMKDNSINIEISRSDYTRPNGGYNKYYGKDVEWDPNTRKYKLVDYITISDDATYDDKMQQVMDEYHYRCYDAFSYENCSSVEYYFMRNAGQNRAVGTYFNVLELENGKTVEDFEASLANVDSSDIKTRVDNWYSGANGISSYQSQLEDTVFCSDTTVTNTSIKDPSESAYDSIALYFGAGHRLIEPKISGVGTEKPTVNCTKDRDAYTVDSANGNGALTYPVGLITADEVVYAGALTNGTTFDDYSDDDQINAAQNISNLVYFSVYGSYNHIWTMSPAFSNNVAARWFTYSSRGYLMPLRDINSGEVRPVVSLKAGITVTGDGSGDSPYVVQQ